MGLYFDFVKEFCMVAIVNIFLKLWFSTFSFWKLRRTSFPTRTPPAITTNFHFAMFITAPLLRISTCLTFCTVQAQTWASATSVLQSFLFIAMLQWSLSSRKQLSSPELRILRVARPDTVIKLTPFVYFVEPNGALLVLIMPKTGSRLIYSLPPQGAIENVLCLTLFLMTIQIDVFLAILETSRDFKSP